MALLEFRYPVENREDLECADDGQVEKSIWARRPREGGGGMTTLLPDRIRKPVIPIPKHLLKELEEIVERAEAEPELVHWYHFVPCAGVRYYSYHTFPSPVEPTGRRKG